MKDFIHRPLNPRWVLGLALAAGALVLTSCSNSLSWEVAYPSSPLSEGVPRVEVAAHGSWVGMAEDQFGVRLGATQHDLRISRHCSGEWTVTYPSTVMGRLPAPGTDLRLLVWEHKNEPGLQDVEPLLDVGGMMATNGVTASFDATPAMDQALFVNGARVLVVATPSGAEVSESQVWIMSRLLWPAERNPDGPSRLPGDLKNICPGSPFKAGAEVEPAARPSRPSRPR